MQSFECLRFGTSISFFHDRCSSVLCLTLYNIYQSLLLSTNHMLNQNTKRRVWDINTRAQLPSINGSASRKIAKCKLKKSVITNHIICFVITYTFHFASSHKQYSLSRRTMTYNLSISAISLLFCMIVIRRNEQSLIMIDPLSAQCRESS